MTNDNDMKSVNDNTDTRNNEKSNIPPIVINAQYVKDLSLEIPHAPEIFRKITQAPDVHVNVDVNANHMHDNFFNVALNLRIDGDVNQEKFFILELEYDAIVSLNIPKEHVEPVLLVEVPRLMFPFVRSIVTHCLTEGGLPPLMLNPIDFVAMYQNRQAANQAQQDNQTQQA